MITRQHVAAKLTDYLKHRISIGQLVDWAERALMDEDFDLADIELLRNAISRIGVADVRSFGLSWEECEGLLSGLGYQVQVEILPAS